jgi:hypothetical protein
VFTNFALAGEVVEGKGVTTAESKSVACDRAMAMAKKEAIEFLGIKISTEVNMLQSDINGITTQSFDLKVKEQTNAVIKVLERSVKVQFDETTSLITCKIKAKFEITLNNAPNRASQISNQPSEMAQNRIRKILENANSLNKAGAFDTAIFQYKTILDLSIDPEMRQMALDGIVNASLSLRSANLSQAPENSPSLSVLKGSINTAPEDTAIQQNTNLRDGIYGSVSGLYYGSSGQEIMLTQKRNKITGTYSSGEGSILGTRTGNIIELKFEVDGYGLNGINGRKRGSATLEINANGNKLVGSVGSRKWVLTKWINLSLRSANLSQAPQNSPSLSVLKGSINTAPEDTAIKQNTNLRDGIDGSVSGLYYGSSGQEIMLTQKRNKITGTYASGEGSILGTRTGNIIELKFEVDGYGPNSINGRKRGSATLEINANGNKLVGSVGSRKWVLTKWK